MAKESFLEKIKDLPDDYEFVLSEYSILENDHIVIYDIPLCGIVFNEETKEIRFLTESSNKKALEKLEKIYGKD